MRKTFFVLYALIIIIALAVGCAKCDNGEGAPVVPPTEDSTNIAPDSTQEG